MDKKVGIIAFGKEGIEKPDKRKKQFRMNVILSDNPAKKTAYILDATEDEIAELKKKKDVK